MNIKFTIVIVNISILSPSPSVYSISTMEGTMATCIPVHLAIVLVLRLILVWKPEEFEELFDNPIETRDTHHNIVPYTLYMLYILASSYTRERHIIYVIYTSYTDYMYISNTCTYRYPCVSKNIIYIVSLSRLSLQ